MKIHEVPAHGAEDVLVATRGRDEGAVFTGTADGSVWRLAHGGRELAKVADTRGRPLGIEEHPDGRLLVCDAQRGLLLVDPRTGWIEELVTEVDGRPMKFCNNAAIADDGTIWFSDSSQQFGIDRWKHEFVRHTRTGRLMRRTPEGQVEVVVAGLAFANGVALAADGSFVVVAETAGRTLVRRWLTGERAGTQELFAGDLPGYPDNIARGSDGLIWVTIASPRDLLVELLHRSPSPLRTLASLIPEQLQPQPRRTVRVQAYDDQGAVVHDLDLPADRFHMATGVREHDGKVWIGSLIEPAVAVTDVPVTG